MEREDRARTAVSLLEGRDGGRPALVDPEGAVLTYGRLREHAKRLASTLAGLGVRRGDRVVVVLPNGPEPVIAFLGAALAGTAAFLNPTHSREELRSLLTDLDARAVIVPAGAGEAAAAERPAGAALVEMRVEGDGTLALRSHPDAPGRDPLPPSPDDVALTLHSSGTTDRPKRVPLRHRSVVAAVANVVGAYDLGADDVAFCPMPLFHVHGLIGATMSTLSSGGTVIVPRSFQPFSLTTALRRHRATWYTAVPTIHQFALARAREERAVVPSLRFVRSASMKLPGAVLERLEAYFGVPAIEAYGMTEAAHQVATNLLPPAERVPGSVGVGRGVDIAIADASGRLLPPGEAGEIVIRGPSVFDGYEGAPEKNAAAFVDGWFRTGDSGTLDARGNLTISGRLKEIIVRGGEKISPHRVEEVLLAHPAVEEAVCFAVPHDVWGEEVAVACVLRSSATAATLLRHCRERLAPVEVPTVVRIVPSIPRTATGKIQRARMAAALSVA